MARVGWSTDQTAAYLYDDQGRVTHRWIQGRPDISTFDPFTYGYGQGQGQGQPAQGGMMYDAWQGGGGVGGNGGGVDEWWHPEGKVAYEEGVREWEMDYAEKVKAREQLQQQADAYIAQDERRLAAEIQWRKEQIAATTGDIRLQHELALVELEQRHQYDIQYLQADYTERHKILDKEIAQAQREMWSRERIEAATRGAQPINYRVYEQWLAGLGGQADPSGLPAGAPAFQTGPGMEGAVVPGQAPGPSPYAQAYATGQRIPEFQAYGRTPTAIGGEPWVDPHKMNVSQFVASPLQSQEMQYGRWWEGGLMPNTAQQRMWAAAPTGGAQGAPGYG